MSLKLTEMAQNWIIFTPYAFIKNLIYLRDSYVKFMGKNKVGNTMWPKLWNLIGQKRQNSFQKTHSENFFVSIRRTGKQASKHLASSFPFLDFYILSSLLSCYFSGISCTFHFGKMFNGFLALQFSCILVRLSEGMILFAVASN